MTWAAVAGGLAAGGAAVAGNDPVAAALAMTAVAIAVFRPRDPERWHQGADGERATAVLLERLGARDFVVLHDRRVPGSRANIDHVVIGRSGVWVVDTKAPRRPVRAGWRSVWVGGHRLDTGPVAWEAQVVADRLGAVVTPIVAVHAAGLPRRGRRCRGVRVVPADRVARRIGRGRRRLSGLEVAELADTADAVFSPAARARRYG